MPHHADAILVKALAGEVPGNDIRATQSEVATLLPRPEVLVITAADMRLDEQAHAWRGRHADKLLEHLLRARRELVLA